MSVPKLRFKADDGSEFPEWKKSTIISHCQLYNGDRGKNYPSGNDIVEDGVVFVNAGDLVDGKINAQTVNRISREKYNILGGAKIKRHDILYCLRGSLGKNAIADDIDEGTVASSLLVIRAIDIHYKYLFYVLNSDIEYKQRILHDEGCAQPNLSAKNVGKFIIPVPCAEEQKKIADFLSTIDRVIEQTQSEIDAWEKQKRGVMQLLFSQKVRFKADDGSEFPEWENSLLGDFCDSISSGKAKKSFHNGQYILYGSTGEIGRTDISEYFGLHVIVARVGSAGIVSLRDGEYGVSDNALVIENKDTLVTRFLYYQLMAYDLRRLISGSNQPLITGKQLKMLSLEFPCFKEQQKIAACLSALDTVIDKTKQELAAYRELKKGLLQQMFV